MTIVGPVMGPCWTKATLSLQVAVLAAAAVGVAFEPALARTPAPTVHHHLRRHPARHAQPQPLQLRLPAADDFGAARSGDGYSGFAPSSSFSDRRQTAIDYRLAPRGPVGSLGLLRSSATPSVAPTSVGQGSALRHDYPEVDAGAKLSYPF
jgi:hypothetical protein